jgi:hypothetical protein
MTAWQYRAVEVMRLLGLPFALPPQGRQKVCPRRAGGAWQHWLWSADMAHLYAPKLQTPQLISFLKAIPDLDYPARSAQGGLTA